MVSTDASVANAAWKQHQLERHWKAAFFLHAIFTAAMVVSQYVSAISPTPQHTSMLMGQAWITELLCGHPARFYNMFGMHKPIFHQLCRELIIFAGLGPTWCHWWFPHRCTHWLIASCSILEPEGTIINKYSCCMYPWPLLLLSPCWLGRKRHWQSHFQRCTRAWTCHTSWEVLSGRCRFPELRCFVGALPRSPVSFERVGVCTWEVSHKPFLLAWICDWWTTLLGHVITKSYTTSDTHKLGMQLNAFLAWWNAAIHWWQVSPSTAYASNPKSFSQSVFFTISFMYMTLMILI